MTDYAKWTVPQLKNELRLRGAPLSGNKSALVERLSAYDRNDNFSQVLDQTVYESFATPNVNSYKDLNAGKIVPTVTEQHVSVYLKRFDKEKDEGPRKLYADRFLHILRVSSDTSDDLTFFKAYVNAQMKKTVSYIVDVAVSKSGEVKKCHCDCTVGNGDRAHCKHVAVVLHALCDFCKTGTFLKELTCTEKLQTFHKPSKLFKGSPVKASTLIRDNCVPKPKDFSRKPELKYVDYNTHVRQCILNNPIHGAYSNFSMKQLYGPANLSAVHMDHNYSKLSLEHIKLQSLGLCDLTAEKIKQIEMETRGQSKNPKWFAERSIRCTASKFHAVLHANDKNKMDTISSSILYPKKFYNPSCEHGLIYEAKAIEFFELASNLETEECGLFIHEKMNFIGASPDRIINSSTILEVKCPYSIREEKISAENYKHIYMKDDALALKETSEYYTQIQGQLLVTGASSCFFTVYTFNDFIMLEVERDELFIQELVTKLETFYMNSFRDAVLKKHLYREME